MTEDKFSLSRRKALAALGTIGVASAGAGLGTSAYFSDQETFENNQLTAGTLDLKVAWQEHYSNWMDDDYGTDPLGRPLGVETEFARMPDGDEQADLYLPPGDGQSDAMPIELVFTDDDTGDDEGGYDSRPDEADGGRQFLRNTQRTNVNGGLWYGPNSLCDEPNDAEGRAVFEVDDVKPGDFGMGLFRLQICDNPGYLWLNGNLVDASEGDVTEPEADDPDEESGVVELLDEIQVAYAVGTTKDLSLYADPTEAEREQSPLPLPETGGAPQDGLENQTTLRDFLNQLSSGTGIELTGDVDAEDGGGSGSQGCFSGESNHYASVVWWLPIDHGNQVQDDSVTFDLGFYTEQCRHNDGSGMPSVVSLDGDVAGPRTFATTSTESHRGSGAWQSAGTDKEVLYLGPSPDFTPDFDNSLPAFTVDEIDEISYWTKKDEGPAEPDFYLLIYTEPQGGTADSSPGTDDDSWYDKRLNAEPSYASLAGEPVDAPADEWNQWSTGGVGGNQANQLRFVDENRPGIGYGYADGTMPTLGDLQAGSIDWSSLRSGAQSTSIDYGAQTVMTLALSTGSSWDDGFDGYLDDVTVRLTDGTEVVFDLEP